MNDENSQSVSNQKQSQKDYQISYQELFSNQAKNYKRLKQIIPSSSNQILDKWTYSTQYFSFLLTHNSIHAFNQLIYQQQQIQYNHTREQNQKINDSYCRQQKIFKQIKHKLQEKLIQNEFQLFLQQNKQQNFKHNFIRIKVINNMQNYQIIQIYCKLAQFAKRYTVLNIFQTSFRHDFPVIGCGGMGQVFLNKNIQPNSNNVNAIKCMAYNPQNKQHLENHIKEFFITDILSSLQIGPKILRPLGFDFIIFERCLQFQLEKCENLYSSKLEQDLKLIMLQMHILNIVHSDIKPSNIMYSPSFKKNVFIDFGISQFIHESFGQLTLTKFKGTFQFCSEQMKRIISKRNLQKIDMYKNDVIMLKKSFLFFQKQSKDYTMKDFEQKNIHALQENYDIFTNAKLKHYLLIKSKYFLYINRQSRKISNSLNEIFLLMQSLSDETIKTEYIKKVLNFCAILRYKNYSVLRQIDLFNSYDELVSFAEEIIQKPNQIYQFSFSIFPQNYEIATIKQRATIVQNLQKKKQNSDILQIGKKYRIRQKIKKIKQSDIEYILFNKTQAIKFEDEQYFQLFLTYVSFWLCSYKRIPIENKLKAAKLFRQVIESRFNCFGLEYLDQLYLPDIQQYRTNYRDLLWAYGYLLSYCMNDQMDIFKANYLTLIVKETMILNFKYFMYIEKAITRYLIYLLYEPNIPILALTLIQQMELTKLVGSQFSLVTTSIQELQTKGQKILNQTWTKLRFKDIFVNFQELQNNDLSHDKTELIFLLGPKFLIQLGYTNHHNSLIQYLQTIFKYIQVQFQKCYNININKQLFQYALTLLDFRKRQLNLVLSENIKFKTSLGKMVQSISRQKIFDNLMSCFIPQHIIQNSNIISSSECIHFIDKKINCPEISIYFFLDQRLKLSIIRKDIQSLSQILQILSQKTTLSLINSAVFRTLQIPHFNFRDVPGCTLEMCEKFKQFFYQFIQYHLLALQETCREFSQIMIQYHCIKLSYHIMKFNELIQLQFRQYLYEQILQIGTYLHTVSISPNKFYHQAQINIFNQYSYLKIALLEKQSLEYCIQRKKLFYFYLEVLKKFPLNLKNANRDKKYPFPYSISAFIQNNTCQDKFAKLFPEKYWYNKKLRFILNQEMEEFIEQFFAYFSTAFYAKLYDMLSELILVFVRQIWRKKSGFLLNIFTRQMDKFTIKSPWMKTLGQVFYKNLVKLTNNNLEQLPLFIILIEFLSLVQFLAANVKIWKKILYLACKMISKYPKLLGQQIYQNRKRHKKIWYSSLLYLQNNKNSRKYKIVQRQWVKSIQGLTSTDWFKVSKQYTKLKRLKKNPILQRQKIQQKKGTLLISVLTSQHGYNLDITSSNYMRANSYQYFYTSIPHQNAQLYIEYAQTQRYFMQTYQINDMLVFSYTQYQFLDKFNNLCQVRKMIKTIQDNRLIENMKLIVHYDIQNHKENGQNNQNTSKNQINQPLLIKLKQEYKSLQNDKMPQIMDDNLYQTLLNKQLILNKQILKQVQQIKLTQRFIICEQTMELAIELLNQQQKNLINQLIDLGKLPNQFQLKQIKSINYHNCFEIVFRSIDNNKHNDNSNNNNNKQD